MKTVKYLIRVAVARFVYNHIENEELVDEDIKYAEFKMLEKAIA